MDSGRRAFNPRSRGLYSSISVSFYMIFTFASFIANAVGWLVPNNVTRTKLSRVWSPCAMTRVVGRETPSGAASVAASAREGEVLPPMIT